MGVINIGIMVQTQYLILRGEQDVPEVMQRLYDESYQLSIERVQKYNEMTKWGVQGMENAKKNFKTISEHNFQGLSLAEMASEIKSYMSHAHSEVGWEVVVVEKFFDIPSKALKENQ